MIQTYDRTWDVEITRSKTGDGRTVTAYAAVFGQEAEISDQHGHYVEELDRASFNKTLTEYRPGKVKCFYNHGYDLTGKPNMLGAVPLGSPVEPPRVDGQGLLTVTRYNKSALADAVLEAIDNGDITGQSFRGRIFNSRTVERAGRLPKIYRTELGLAEYGPTHSPAYTGAGILAVRAGSELADLVRTILDQIQHPDGAAGQGTPSGPPPTVEPGTDSHSGRTRARQLALRMRAIELGVRRDATAADKR
jgi:HK97 family phage prohead protease